jgi:hypothetical protein
MLRSSSRSGTRTRLRSGRLQCLVGKNESGKTAILQALYRLNPIVPDDANFNTTHDYPRSKVEDYQQDVETGRRKRAVAIRATFELEPPELGAINGEYGSDVLARPEVVLSRGYTEKGEQAMLFVGVPVIESAVVKNLVESFDLPSTIKEGAAQAATLESLSAYLTEVGSHQDQALAKAHAEANELQDEADKAAALEKSKTLAESERAKALRARLTELLQFKDGLGLRIWRTILEPFFPKFLYFDEYTIR